MRSPGGFARIRTRATGKAGLTVLGGPLASDPDGSWVAQTYRFRRDLFTVGGARDWVKRNLPDGCLEFEPATGRGPLGS